MAKTTLKTLAQGLNMSVSTVSKALNDSYEISAATKNKVREYAQLNNYQPNVLAQFLKTGKSQTIGVVLPKMSTSFDSQIIEGIQSIATIHNYRIVIMNSMEDEKSEEQALKSMMNKSVDGLLFCPIHENSNVDLAKQILKTTPIVIFDRTNYPLETHKVGVLNAEGTFNACKHLIEIGRKNIAIFCGTDQGITQQRLNGYYKALEQNNLPQIPAFKVYCNVKSIDELHTDLEDHLKSLLKLSNPPDAIIGVTDTITTHLLGILAKLAIRVPETIAVIGFANTEIAFSLNPSLSAIRQPTKEIGELAVRKLIETINKKNRSQIEWEDIKLPTTIQLRHSTLG
ncbi:MAG: LacI family DNA-binding transcriptional regulator [Sphingobacterium sp.]|uniref:LacI family DNA-binding transcriptional regulator n=1 Tax=Sphingobacterium sp. JB170 TaxID=1434842 RepID=UPI00097F1263|nr:LacI family DNA-binding transcriptional regulator [Sphingobacterium sp. JB170]SJN31865.1 LacI family transcriptional regulator [Sphingobacterium sp. JB170]